MNSLICVIVLLSCLCTVTSFIWHLGDTFTEEKVLTFSEHYMFPSKRGPTFLPQGRSSIRVNADFDVLTTYNQSSRLVVAVFASDIVPSQFSICNEMSFRDYPWLKHEIHQRLTPIFSHETTIDAQQLHALNEHQGSLSFLPSSPASRTGSHHGNETWFVYTHSVSINYEVRDESWHTVAFQVCSTGRNSIGVVKGQVAFKNPYGYLPAELYGLLPFEFVRMFAYLAFSVFFGYRYYKYKESALPVHIAVLAVFFVALTESIIWTIAYQVINTSGQPYCCPFPPVVIAALIFQIFRQTGARCLLVVVSLGYGIVRPKLMHSEWMATVVITALYFIAAMIAKVSEIIIDNDVHNNTSARTSSYQVPELLMDVIFLSWIYLALGSTIRILGEFQQTFKLAMYRKLAWTMFIFVALFTIVSVLITLDHNQFIEWPWQLFWLQQVLWEVLNFSVLCAACMICLPSESSGLLAYAAQLPTDDPDDDGYEDEDDEDDEGVNDVEKQQRGNDTTTTAATSTWRTSVGSRNSYGKRDSRNTSSLSSSSVEMVGMKQPTTANVDEDHTNLPTADDEW